ncbi:unnamed protein product [Coffea canephora]|uniref:Cyclin-dependent protein kinase inhibitor SMR6-like n=2 Tax=Coffea TaxID=13442 RepID=A0A068V041_COFCA|nr:unnamed protein product [Coffea canephora]
MGFTEMDEYAIDAEANKWIIAGIALRSPLKPIFTKKEYGGDDQEEECCTTPTAQESRIPARLACPPAPKKRKATARSCNFNNGVREFFNPPDLETIFIRRAEKA